MNGKFKVSFKYAENIYCTNIAIGLEEKIKEYYGKKYEWFTVSEASDYEYSEAKRRGMPIVECK